MTDEERDAYDDLFAEIKTWAICPDCDQSINPDYEHTEKDCQQWQKEMEELRHDGFANYDNYAESLEPDWDTLSGRGAVRSGAAGSGSGRAY